MTLLLAPELTSHDFDSNYSICLTGQRILVYSNQQPVYQIDSLDKIYGATVYRDRLYVVTKSSEDHALFVYDAELGGLIQKFNLQMVTEPDYCQFHYYDTLYLICYQNSADSIRMVKVIGDVAFKLKLRLQTQESNIYKVNIQKSVDFAFYKNYFFCFIPDTQQLFKWVIPEAQAEDQIYFTFMSGEPKRLDSAVFLYQNNQSFYQLFINANEYFDGSFQLEQSNTFFEVVQFENSFILIRDTSRLHFNSKQLMLQFLNAKNVQWTQKIEKEAIKVLPNLINNYDQMILMQKYEDGIMKIQIQFTNLKKLYNYPCKYTTCKCVGFVFIHKDRLVVALKSERSVRIIVLSQETDVPAEILTEFKACDKVEFQFDQQHTELDSLDQLLFSATYDTYSTIQTAEREMIKVQGKIIDFSARENQICYITETAIGIIENNQSVFQMPLLEAKSCYVASRNCFLFLTKEKLHLIIYQNCKIYQYTEDVMKYVANQIRFMDGFIELYGSQNFKLQSNASHTIQLYQALQNNSDRQVVIRLLQNLKEPSYDGSVFVKHIHKRPDKEALISILLQKFPHNEEILFYAIDFYNEKSFLIQIIELMWRAQRHKQFSIFAKIIGKIDKANYSKFYPYLRTHHEFEQLDSAFVNFILFTILKKNPPMFVIYSKTLGIPDHMIVEQLDAYKTDLLKELNEKQVFVYARQCIQQNLQQSNIKVMSGTVQEQFITLMQTLIQLYNINPISGQVLSDKEDYRNKFQKLQIDPEFCLTPMKYNYLKQQVFGSREKDYALQETRLMRYLPVYNIKNVKQFDESLFQVVPDNFLSNTAQTLQQGDWDDEDDKKTKKLKKISIKTKDENVSPNQISVGALPKIDLSVMQAIKIPQFVAPQMSLFEPRKDSESTISVSADMSKVPSALNLNIPQLPSIVHNTSVPLIIPTNAPVINANPIDTEKKETHDWNNWEQKQEEPKEKQNWDNEWKEEKAENTWDNNWDHKPEVKDEEVKQEPKEEIAELKEEQNDWNDNQEQKQEVKVEEAKVEEDNEGWDQKPKEDPINDQQQEVEQKDWNNWEVKVEKDEQNNFEDQKEENWETKVEKQNNEAPKENWDNENWAQNEVNNQNTFDPNFEHKENLNNWEIQQAQTNQNGAEQQNNVNVTGNFFDPFSVQNGETHLNGNETKSENQINNEVMQINETEVKEETKKEENVEVIKEEGERKQQMKENNETVQENIQETEVDNKIEENKQAKKQEQQQDNQLINEQILENNTSLQTEPVVENTVKQADVVIPSEFDPFNSEPKMHLELHQEEIELVQTAPEPKSEPKVETMIKEEPKYEIHNEPKRSEEHSSHMSRSQEHSDKSLSKSSTTSFALAKIKYQVKNPVVQPVTTVDPFGFEPVKPKPVMNAKAEEANQPHNKPFQPKTQGYDLFDLMGNAPPQHVKITKNNAVLEFTKNSPHTESNPFMKTVKKQEPKKKEEAKVENLLDF
ncbi:Conserved_hypothetical protein [Hexamita inflata]|uniref:Uncharacterized protein n=1 Tax=Hexamita inflata TaxID=28002 RepID=A0ABP1J5A4_9EUKA